MGLLKRARDRLDRVAEGHWAKWDVIWVPGVVMVILGIGLVSWIKTSNANLQVGIAVADASFMVAWFAIVNTLHTRRLANLSTETIRLSTETINNAAVPVIKLDAEQSGSGTHFKYHNIGRGPALNLQFWISHEDFPEMESAQHRIFRTATGPGESGQGAWGEQHELPRLSQGVDIITQYEDVFGRLFESRLEFVSNAAPLLHYGRLKGETEDKRVYS